MRMDMSERQRVCGSMRRVREHLLPIHESFGHSRGSAGGCRTTSAAGRAAPLVEPGEDKASADVGGATIVANMGGAVG